MTDYTPIPCDLYSRYELAIIQARRLRLSWTDEGGGAHLSVVVPVDLQTRSGHGEFLIARDAEGRQLEIRLDRIRATRENGG